MCGLGSCGWRRWWDWRESPPSCPTSVYPDLALVISWLLGGHVTSTTVWPDLVACQWSLRLTSALGVCVFNKAVCVCVGGVISTEQMGPPANGDAPHCLLLLLLMLLLVLFLNVSPHKNDPSGSR